MNNLTRSLFTSALQSSESDTFSLDNSVRVKCCNSSLYSFFHFKQKSRLDAIMLRDLNTFFKDRYGIQDDQAFQRIWEELSEKIWTTNLPVTIGTLRQIDAAFQKNFIYHGAGISAPPPIKEEVNNGPVQQAVKALLHGGPLSAEMLEPRVLKAVFINKDIEFLSQMRVELQHELDNLAEHPPTTKQEELVWRAFLGNILALLPFAYPPNDEKIIIPVLNNDGSCLRIKYNIQLIQLTTGVESTPLRALGLTAENAEQGQPILIFSGTTYPGGDGFAACVLADFTPGRSVGERPYLQGQKNIEAWMEGKKGIHVLGVSLGGALSLQTLRFHHENIARIDAYNPPGLYPWDWKKEYNEGCEINIYCQAGDSVSPMGAWPTGDKVSLYHVIPHQKGVEEGPILSHARAFTGCEKVTILKKDPKVENKSWTRKVLTFLHLTLSPIVVFLPTYGALKLYQMVQAISGLFQRAIGHLNACIKASANRFKRKKPIG